MGATDVTYAEFRQAFFDRHQPRATSALSTAGDVLPVLGVFTAVVKRDRRWVFRGLLGGVFVASVAHLFPPRSLGGEYAAIFRHPVWAARAERERVRGGAVSR